MATDSNYTLLKFVVTVFCHKISQKHSKKTTKTKSIPQHCCGPFRRFINTRFEKSIKKEWTEEIKNSKILYKCITANTSVIWKHAAHTTDQLSSPNR